MDRAAPVDGLASAARPPRLSPLDNCFTHADRDFILDPGPVGPTKALPFSLSSEHDSRDGSARPAATSTSKAEWMYLFAPFRSVWLFEDGDEEGWRSRGALPPRAFPWTPAATERERNSASPFRATPVAVGGPLLAADCGHLKRARGSRRHGDPPRSRPGLGLHEEGSGRFSLSIRAMSHAPGDRQRLGAGAPSARALPLPGPGRVRRELPLGLPLARLTRSSSTGAAGKGWTKPTNSQERPAAHPSDVDQSESGQAEPQRP